MSWFTVKRFYSMVFKRQCSSVKSFVFQETSFHLKDVETLCYRIYRTVCSIKSSFSLFYAGVKQAAFCHSNFKREKKNSRLIKEGLLLTVEKRMPTRCFIEPEIFKIKIKEQEVSSLSKQTLTHTTPSTKMATPCACHEGPRQPHSNRTSPRTHPL